MLQLKGHGSTRTVYSVAFAPSEETLASSGLDGTVRLWDLRTGKEQAHFGGAGYHLRSVAFSPDGKTLAWSDREKVVVRDLTAGGVRTLDLKRWPLRKVFFSPDGRRLASAGDELHLWDLATGVLATYAASLLHSGTTAGRVSMTGCAAFAPDSRTVAVPVSIRNAGGRLRHVIDLGEPPPTKASRPVRLAGHTHAVSHLAFAPSGLLLAASCGPYLCVWDVGSGERLLEHKAGSLHFQEVAFTPDGRFLAATHNDKAVRFWDVQGWRERRAYDWNIGEVVSLAIAPDGMRAAAGGRSGRIVVWDLDDL